MSGAREGAWTGPLALVVLIGVASCLEERTPSVGRHIVADRDIAQVTFSRAGTAPAGTKIVYAKALPSIASPETPTIDRPGDLYAISPEGGEPALLVSSIDLWDRLAEWDSKGRLYVSSAEAPPAPPRNFRVDPITGVFDDFGQTGAREAGDWEILGRTIWDGGYPRDMLTARSLNGAVLDLGEGELVGVSGERIYVKGNDRTLRCFTAGEGAVVLAERVCGASAVGESADDRLLVSSFIDLPPTDTGKGPCPALPAYRLALLNGATGTEEIVSERTAFHRGGWPGPNLSPDGTKLALLVRPEGAVPQVSILALDRPGEAQIDVPLGGLEIVSPGSVGPVLWRPGTGEIWSFVYEPPVTHVLRADQSLERLDRPGPQSQGFRRLTQAWGGIVDPLSETYSRRSYHPSLPFTDDGRFWLSSGSDGRLYLNDASVLGEPEGPALPNGISEIVPLPRGDAFVVRLWISYDDNGSRSDLVYVEPWNGVSRTLAERVDDAVYGSNRILTLSSDFGYIRAGDLTLVETATGRKTVIAQNVTSFALAPCDGCDPLTPGTPIVYSVHAPHPYQYDGIWVGTLP